MTLSQKHKTTLKHCNEPKLVWILLQQTDYYPYGLPKPKPIAPEINPFKYSGKELYTDLSLTHYDFAARLQLPAIGLFQRPDPKASDFTWLNSYTFCGGDPVNRVDPDGMDWYMNNETSCYVWFTGNATREGYTHVGDKGSLLGEFESKISDILATVFKHENGLYSEGQVVDITDPNKGAIIPSDLSKMDDFLDEFVFGYGPEISILTSDHPYTRDLQTEDKVIESQQKIRIGETDVPGQITNVRRNWGPLDVLTTTSIAKQFVGSYSFDAYTSTDKKHFLNIIYDTKNFRSLFYHIPGTEKFNHSRMNSNKYFSTTYQFYIWRSKK